MVSSLFLVMLLCLMATCKSFLNLIFLLELYSFILFWSFLHKASLSLWSSFSAIFMLVFLIFEGVVGLTLLVVLARMKGSDSFVVSSN